jgi:thymidylate synthase
MLNPIFIEARDLSDAWFQAVYKCIEVGKSFKIDRGSYAGSKRLEFDYITIHIKYPWTTPLLPSLNPLLNIPDPVPGGMNYVYNYLTYLMTGEAKKGESYTYGQRICRANAEELFKYTDKLFHIDELKELPKTISWYEDNEINRINQMELLIWTYKNKGHRNNQMILQIGQPSDIALKDPACLRHIDTRIQDGKLHFFPYFRSWDLWSGFPANLAAIELMKKYCAECIGVENGEMIVSSKGLHLYDYTWELAELIRGKTIQEFKDELMNNNDI